MKLIRLYRKYKEIINYIIVGGLTTIVSLASYYICIIFFLDPQNPIQLQIANIISWISAVTFAYVTNRIFVFESKDQRIIREATSFFIARVSTLLIDMASMFLMVSVFHMNDKIAKIIVQFIIMVLNYVFSKLFVFRVTRGKELPSDMVNDDDH